MYNSLISGSPHIQTATCEDRGKSVCDLWTTPDPAVKTRIAAVYEGRAERQGLLKQPDDRRGTLDLREDNLKQNRTLLSPIKVNKQTKQKRSSERLSQVTDGFSYANGEGYHQVYGNTTKWHIEMVQSVTFNCLFSQLTQGWSLTIRATR